MIVGFHFLEGLDLSSEKPNKIKDIHRCQQIGQIDENRLKEVIAIYQIEMIPDFLRILQQCFQQLQKLNLQLDLVAIVDVGNDFFNKSRLLNVSQHRGSILALKCHFIGETPNQKGILMITLHQWGFVAHEGNPVSLVILALHLHI